MRFHGHSRGRGRSAGIPDLGRGQRDRQRDQEGDPDETARYLASQDTGLIRHMRFHQIERHPTQLKQGGGTDYSVDAVPAQEREPVGEPAGEQ